jgi:group I intron endonuclease
MNPMESYGFVYETTNKINGMKYIGKCVYGRKNDWEKYLGSGLYLKRAIKKYGRENFIRTTLEEASSEEELQLLEENYIKRFNAVESPQYYNIKMTSMGGDTYTTNPNREHIRKLKQANMSGERNHQYGKPKTECMINSVKESNRRAVEVDGVFYESQVEACKATGLKPTLLAYRLSSNLYPTYIRLQPNQRNNSKNIS